jgi:hypothetical protein
VTDAGEAPDDTPESVASLAQLYLGNILFALERCAMSLESDAKPNDAAFYRGIARKLAEAHGKTRPEVGGRRPEER